MLDSETYIGGKVECLHSGIYRADLLTDFNLDSSAFQRLITDIDDIINFIVDVENKDKNLDAKTDVVNREEIKNEIT